jgi:hypothetical protein
MHKTLLALTLSVFGIACIGSSTDVRGTYDATMIRSSSPACAAATPTPKIVQTTVQIDNAEHIIIGGALPCTASWYATDYGPVGQVSSVSEGCALQPTGSKFAGGGFGSLGFSMTWQPADNDKCTITDDWTLGEKH